MNSKPLNKLAHEASPYLKLHADNPVEWYPWGEEAFDRARKENKPIFLSIGYSTCHWCHVMARESFADQEIADLLNKYFISVKVDREDRPDVDQLYMMSYQVIVGEGGGWPLNVFLTPELKMFTGGTYFPPQAKGGRIGFNQLLINISQAWQKDGEKIKTHSEQNYQLLAQQFKQNSAEQIDIEQDLVQQAAAKLHEFIDPENGGWGANQQGPKFPEASNLSIMLRAYASSQNKNYLDAVTLTADKMLYGGIYDQLSGGFHRYSVDAKWLVPHFEKMLYDQAQLIDLYLDLWLITGNSNYKRIVAETADYVIAEMQAPDLGEQGNLGEEGKRGGYYSAQDAQSEHKEGKFCCWTSDELQELLTGEEYSITSNYYGITRQGNFYDHSDPQALENQNVLSIINEQYQLADETEQELLERAKTKMRQARALRTPAATDDKILASWNGMMIAAMARVGIILEQPAYLESAQQAYQFIKSKLWKNTSDSIDSTATALNHSWCAGEINKSQQSSSYFSMLRAARTLYQTTLNNQYLDDAIELADTAYPLFTDTEQGGFYESADTADIVLRLKGRHDGAIPESASIATLEYSLLGEITDQAKYKAIAKQSIKANSQSLVKQPQSLSYLLNTIDFEQTSTQQLVIATGTDTADTTNNPNNLVKKFLKTAHSIYQPNLIIKGNTGQIDSFSKSLQGVENPAEPTQNIATAYLCQEQTCQAPTNSPQTLEQQLKGS